MKTFLTLLFALFLATPAYAEAPVLEIKRTTAEVQGDPIIQNLKQKLDAQSSERTAMENAQTDIVNQNVMMAKQWADNQKKGAFGDQQGINNAANQYRDKAQQLGQQTSGLNTKMVDKKQETDAVYRQLQVATWKARIADDAYQVYAGSGVEVVQNKEDARYQSRVILFDKDGKKFLLQTPENIVPYNTPTCKTTVTVGAVLALREAETVPVKEGETSVLKVASLDQIYFPGRTLAASCPFGKTVEKSPAQ